MKLDQIMNYVWCYFITGLITLTFVMIGVGIHDLSNPTPLEMYKRTITACTDDNCRVAVNRFYRDVIKTIINDGVEQ